MYVPVCFCTCQLLILPICMSADQLAFLLLAYIHSSRSRYSFMSQLSVLAAVLQAGTWAFLGSTMWSAAGVAVGPSVPRYSAELQRPSLKVYYCSAFSLHYLRQKALFPLT